MRYAKQFCAVLGTVLCVSPTLADTWQFGPEMPLPREHCGAAKDALGRIYIVGGTGDHRSEVIRFDESTGEWEFVAPLILGRNDSAVASDHLGRIYAAGGATESGATATVERYDPVQNTWAEVAPLPEPRVQARAVTDSQGRIYVVGGFLGWDNVYSSVYVYDPLADTWSYHSDMLVPRAIHGLAIDSSGRIYAIGGATTGSVHTNTVERYDPIEGTWSFIDSLSSSRQVGVAMADCLDRIYAIGGWEPGYTCKVERFDPGSGLWEDFTPILECHSNMAGIRTNSGRLYIFGGDPPLFGGTTKVEFLEIPECADSDGDGVPDDVDNCPNSDLGGMLVIDGCDTEVPNQLFSDGCSMADLGNECADGTGNHGAFVICVAQLTKDWKQTDLITGQQKGRIQSCAAQADIWMPCQIDADCNDGLFCNGVEICLEGDCVVGDPCPGQGCDEVDDVCVE